MRRRATKKNVKWFRTVKFCSVPVRLCLPSSASLHARLLSIVALTKKSDFFRFFLLMTKLFCLGFLRRLVRRLGRMTKQHKLEVPPHSRDRHRYHAASERYGAHAAAAAASSAGAVFVRPYTFWYAFTIAPSPVGNTSARASPKIRNMWALHTPRPRSDVSAATTWSSLIPDNFDDDSIPVLNALARVTRYSALRPERPALRSFSTGAANTADGVNRAAPPSASSRRLQIVAAALVDSCCPAIACARSVNAGSAPGAVAPTEASAPSGAGASIATPRLLTDLASIVVAGPCFATSNAIRGHAAPRVAHAASSVDKHSTRGGVEATAFASSSLEGAAFFVRFFGGSAVSSASVSGALSAAVATARAAPLREDTRAGRDILDEAQRTAYRTSASVSATKNTLAAPPKLLRLLERTEKCSDSSFLSKFSFTLSAFCAARPYLR